MKNRSLTCSILLLIWLVALDRLLLADRISPLQKIGVKRTSEDVEKLGDGNIQTTSDRSQLLTKARVAHDHDDGDGDNDDDMSDDDSDDNDDSDKDENGQLVEKKSIFNRLKEFAGRAMSPGYCYMRLVKRYRNWFSSYNKFKKDVEDKHPEVKLRTGMQVVRAAYVESDKELIESHCQSAPNNKKKQYEVENVDFVMQILRRVIDRLEQIMPELEQLKGNLEALANKHNVFAVESDYSSQETNSDDDGNESTKSDKEVRGREVLETDEQRALKRAKRIAMFAVGRFATLETYSIVKLMLLRALAIHVQNREKDPSAGPSVIDYLEPLIILMGAPQYSVLTNYYMDIQFRVVFAAISHSWSWFKSCKLNQVSDNVQTKLISQQADESSAEREEEETQQPTKRIKISS